MVFRYRSAMEQEPPLNPTRVVGLRVAQIRTSRGMTQEALAEAMRVQTGVEMERVVIAKLEKGLRPFIKLDELWALCLVLRVTPIDMLVPAELDGSQWYAITPLAAARVDTVRDWIKGETVMMQPYEGRAAGLYSAEVRPTAAEAARAIQWMPDDRGREVMQRWLEKQKQWEERKQQEEQEEPRP
jgi:transcriptional regulator with XRE-family HTH domain